MLNLYDIVRIKKTGETGFVIDISWDEDGSVGQYLVEKDNPLEDGRHETEWFYPEEVKYIDKNKGLA